MFNLITTERIHGNHKIPHVTQVLYNTTTGTTRAPMIPFDKFIIVIISFGWNMYRYLNRIKFDTLNCQRIYITQVTPRPTVTTCHGGYTWNDTKNKKHNPTPPSDNLIASVSPLKQLKWQMRFKKRTNRKSGGIPTMRGSTKFQSKEQWMISYRNYAKSLCVKSISRI